MIINSKAKVKEKIETLAQALSYFDLDQIYIELPIRELLDMSATH